MSNFREKFLPLFFISLLLCILIVQTRMLLEDLSRTRKVPVFMPLLVPGEDYSSYDMERLGAQSAKVLNMVGRIGPTISLEDIVRGISLLEKKENLMLSSRQRKKISSILKETYKKRDELLKCQSEIQELEREMPILGLHIYEILTPQQRDYITTNRDKISLKKFEEGTWKDLIKSMENDLDKAGK